MCKLPIRCSRGIYKMISEKRKPADSSDFHYEKSKGATDHAAEAHHHSQFEFYYPSRGDLVYLVGSKTYEVKEGDVVVIPEGVVHKAVYADGCRERQIVRFKSHYLPESLREYFRTSPPVIRCRDIRGAVEDVLEKIEHEYLGYDKYSADMLRSYVCELAVALARCNNVFDATAEKSPAVATVLTYIREHSAERISLADMAKICKVSTAYLSRRFKQEIGVGFSDYLSSFRLRRAEAMLREMPEMSITEIAFSCGFNDSNYFSDKFKKQFGASPLKFRKAKK